MADESSIQQSNPLSRKLNKILETRLDNDKVSLSSIKLLYSDYFCTVCDSLYVISISGSR